MHKIYLRQALMHVGGFSRVLRHSNSNNTFISIVFGFFWDTLYSAFGEQRRLLASRTCIVEQNLVVAKGDPSYRS